MKLLMYCGGPVSVRHHRTDCIGHASFLPLQESSAAAQQASNGNFVCVVLNTCK